MSRTINGKDYAQFFAELTAPFATDKKYDGASYVTIKSIHKRIAEVAMPWNYVYEAGQPLILTARSTMSVVVVGKLTIIDDEGNVVATRQVPGGCDIAFSNNYPERTATELKSAVASASTEAYKNCWQEFGVGADDVSYPGKGKGKTNTGSNAELACYDVQFLTDFVARNNTLYADVEMPDGSKRQLVIMQKGIQWMADAYETTMEHIVPLVVNNYGANKQRKAMRVYGTLSEFRGTQQLVFVQGVKGGKRANG